MNGFEEFLEKVRDSTELKKELSQIPGSDDAYAAAFVAIGAREGYTFTADDVDGLMEHFAGDMLTNEQLSDAELEAVAGGGKGSSMEAIGEAIISWFDSCP